MDKNFFAFMCISPLGLSLPLAFLISNSNRLKYSRNSSHFQGYFPTVLFSRARCFSWKRRKAPTHLRAFCRHAPGL
jgi:hypothetical protein